MKILIIFLLLFSYMQSSTFNINEIRKDFHNTVIKNSTQKRDEIFTINEKYWNKILNYLWMSVEYFSHSQFVTFVDLSKQILVLVLWDNEEKSFHYIGFDFVSTGNIEKEAEVTNGDSHYLKTPAGLFDYKSGWRSNGEFLEDNVTKPYGDKDTYVFFFGEQDSIRYNTFDSNGTKITDPNKWQLISDKLQFAIHAHKSAASFGKPHSHGCIRMSNELNLFLDNNSVFFKKLYNENKKWIHPYNKVPKDAKNQEVAGEYLLIIDGI